MATDWSVEDCVSWLGAASHCVFIASARASCTALEMEAERACILKAIRGCSVEVDAIGSVTRARFAELRVRVSDVRFGLGGIT